MFMNYKEQMKLNHHEKSIINYYKKINPKLFLTLIFRSDLPRSKAKKSLRSFINKMNNRFFVRSSGDRLRLLPVLEMGCAIYENQGSIGDNTKANWHIHIIMEDPTERDCKVSGMSLDELKKIIGNLWDSVGYGDIAYTARYNKDDWFKNIYDLGGVLNYLHKEVVINEQVVMHEYANNTGVKMAS